jgi:hypothetical protein
MQKYMNILYLQTNNPANSNTGCTCALMALVVPPSTLTAKHCLSQARAVIHSLHFAALHSVHYFLPLLSPQKNSTTRQKTRQPCVFHVGNRSPRSTRSRLAPLHYAGKKSLRYHSADFSPAPFRFKVVLPALFWLRPHQPPTTHP